MLCFYLRLLGQYYRKKSKTKFIYTPNYIGLVKMGRKTKHRALLRSGKKKKRRLGSLQRKVKRGKKNKT